MTTTGKNGRQVNASKGVQGFHETRRSEPSTDIDLGYLRKKTDAAYEAALNTVKENCRHIGYNSLADMIERLHDRGQVDITDSAELTTEELAVLGERHFSGLVDRFCDTLEPAEPATGVDEMGQDEFDRFKHGAAMELGATTTTMEALEAAMGRAEIPAGTFDSMTQDTMDTLEDHTERALDRLATDVRIFLNE